MTNNKIENIYSDLNGKIFNCLEGFVHEVLFPYPVINLTVLFCNIKFDYMWSVPRI